MTLQALCGMEQVLFKLVLPLDWVVKVWGRGLAVVAGRFGLSVLDATPCRDDPHGGGIGSRVTPASRDRGCLIEPHANAEVCRDPGSGVWPSATTVLTAPRRRVSVLTPR